MRTKGQREKGIVGPEAWENSVYVEEKQGRQSRVAGVATGSGL